MFLHLPPPLAVLLAVVAIVASAAEPVEPPPRTMKILALHGSAHERGRQHGRHFRREIAQLVLRWQQSLAQELKRPADEAIRQFLTATDFIPAIQHWTPDLLDEVHGLAEGAGQPFDTMLAFQLGDELYAYLDLRAHDHCSALGVAPADRRSGWVAQTMDLEPIYDGFQTILRITDDSDAPEQIVLTYPGLIGLNGLNDRSVAVACNTLLQLASSPTGLPQSFVVRGVLAQRDAVAALAFIRTVPHASGQNYLVGTPSRIFDFEASARRVVELKPNAQGTLSHTNHPLVNDDVKRWIRRPPATSDTVVRLEALQRRLQRSGDSLGHEDILNALRSRESMPFPICRPVSTTSVVFSFSGVIMTLGDTPSLDASPGPPDAHPMQRFLFSNRKTSPQTPAIHEPVSP